MQRYDTARLYLYRVLPWSPIGDPTAFINIMWTIQGAGYSKPGWRGAPCQSIEECITTIQRAQRNPQARDIYVCMSSQREYEIRHSSNGPFKIAKRSQENARELRTIFCDVDVKEGAYPNTQTALIAFVDFLKRSGLPRPTIFISSGSGGFHAYWVMDRALSVAEWQPLANALAEAMRRFGVKADTACTVDAARVLRVPETYNSKTEPRKLVEMAVNNMLPYDYSVEQMRAALAPYMGAQIIPLTPRGKLDGPNADLAGGIEVPKAPLINLQTVADAGCGFIREAISTGGSQYNNPLWNLTTLISVFTEGGREDAHRMASGHPTYSREDTDALFDRKTTEKEVKNLGWPSCQTIENSGCSSCATCPLKNPASRPLQFGRPTPPQVDPLGGLPHGYSRNPEGYIMRAKKGKEDGTTINVSASPFPIREAWVQDDPWTLHFSARTRPGKTGYSQISITTAQANSSEKFNTVMGVQGIPLDADMSKEFRSFIVAWQTLLQKTRDSVVTAAPYGWSFSDGKIDGFAYGGRLWLPNESRAAAGADIETARQYRPQGELDKWKRAAKMVTDLKSPERDAILAASFAGPLVQFTGVEGLLISAFSVGSGFGKTSVMKVAQAVWGRPAIAMNGLTDTTNSTFSKAALLKNIPLFWDEIKSEQDKIKFAEIAFRVSQGTDKARQQADTSLRRRGEWKTLVIAASNDSIVDIVARNTKSTTAGVYRVFEFPVSRVLHKISGTLADQIVLNVQTNYGQAGLAYAKFLGENHATIHAEVAKVREALELKLKASSEERFWICSMTCLFLGALYARKLGLAEIDCDALMQFFVTVFRRMRGELDNTHVDMSVILSTVNVLGAYLNAKRAKHTLVTDKMITSRGKPRPNEIKILTDISRLDSIDVHRCPTMMRFTVNSFKKWLEDNGYSTTAVIGSLKEQVGMALTTARLGSGTDVSTMTQSVFELHLNHAALAPFVE